MGLITLLVTIAFTVLYFSRSMDKKPPQLERALALMNTHIDKIAKWAGIYGLVAIVLTLLTSYGVGDMLIRLVNNALICLMVLPFTFGRMTEKYERKVNAAIMEEARNLVSWVTTNEKRLSYFSAICATALFLTLFK